MILEVLFTAVGLGFSVPLARIAANRAKKPRERAAAGILATILVTPLLFTPGCSPIISVLHRRKVDELCSPYSPGQPFDVSSFRSRSETLGLRPSVFKFHGHMMANADAIQMLLVSRVCTVEYDDGGIVAVRNFTYAP